MDLGRLFRDTVDQLYKIFRSDSLINFASAQKNRSKGVVIVVFEASSVISQILLNLILISRPPSFSSFLCISIAAKTEIKNARELVLGHHVCPEEMLWFGGNYCSMSILMYQIPTPSWFLFQFLFNS